MNFISVTILVLHLAVTADLGLAESIDKALKDASITKTGKLNGKKSGQHEHDPQHSTYIVGGRDAWPHEFPFMAALLYQWNQWNFQFCGATLINHWQVVTAAHCVDSSDVGSIKVALGVHNLDNLNNGVSQIKDIARVIRHENYDYDTKRNDIALVTFTSPVTYSSYILPVSLPSKVYGEGTMAAAIGWGSTTEFGYASTTLQFVEVPIVNRTDCDSVYRSVSITDDMICAGIHEGGKDACQGDSGGPLFVQNGYELVGITSFGNGCARPGYPGVYADVYHFKNWIETHSAYYS